METRHPFRSPALVCGKSSARERRLKPMHKVWSKRPQPRWIFPSLVRQDAAELSELCRCAEEKIERTAPGYSRREWWNSCSLKILIFEVKIQDMVSGSPF